MKALRDRMLAPLWQVIDSGYLLGLTLLNGLRRAVHPEIHLLALGRLLAESTKAKGSVSSLEEVEFRIFSQWGDDGILQWLTHHLQLHARTFVEFGVEDYRESNTRFLLLNNNWSGVVMDASVRNIRRIKRSEYFWRHDLSAVCAFIDRENINDLLTTHCRGDLDLLHIDIDGNDYWIWQAITVVNPVVVVMEFNSVFGGDRAITIPYQREFSRGDAHFSNLYFGASLPALCQLAQEKGYTFIGCNSAGVNAYFVRQDRLTEAVTPLAKTACYVSSKCRESKDAVGRLTYLSGPERLAAIQGLPVINVATGQEEAL